MKNVVKKVFKTGGKSRGASAAHPSSSTRIEGGLHPHEEERRDYIL